MSILNYNFEGGLEDGFKSLFQASNMTLRTADDIDDGGLPDECMRIELNAGGPISGEHLNAIGNYDNYTGTFEIEVRTPRVEIDSPTPVPIDGFVVSGAGRVEANGTYIRGEDYNDMAVYVLYDSGVPIFYMYGSLATYWSITEFSPSVGGNDSYLELGSNATPPLTGWTVAANGTSPAPTLSSADPVTFKSRHVELVAKTRQLLEEIGAAEITTHWPAAHAPTKIMPTGTAREIDAEFRITTLSYEIQFRIT